MLISDVSFCVFASVDPLAITTLRPHTLYTVRLAALNAVGVGLFSETNPVRTLGIRKRYTHTITTTH